MNNFQEQTEQDFDFDWSSPLGIDRFLASFDSDLELRDRLRAAQVIIIPSDVHLKFSGRVALKDHWEVVNHRLPEYTGPVFPDTTEVVLNLLREELGDRAKVEIATSDDYVEFSFKSIEINLPTLYICDPVLVTTLLPVLAVVIRRLKKSRRGRRTEARINWNFLYKHKNGTLLRMSYSNQTNSFGLNTPYGPNNTSSSTNFY